jgi:PAS domain S-box-containing protein
MNRVAETLTGWKLTEAMGRPLVEVFNIINEQTRKPCDNPVEKVFKTGGIVNLENHTVLLSRDGREVVIADSGAPIKDKESKTIGVVLVFRDNTEKQKTAENMRKVDKLESIGVLAGGIAHDFNNLLGGIFGYVDLAREMCKKDDNVMDALMKALNVLNRARDLTRQLLTFSKGGAPSKTTHSIASIITDTAQFILSGSTVRCEFSIPSDLWSCDVDGNQISQVIDNMVINAQQAMPQGGKIRISAENTTIDNKSSMPLNPGNYVKIRIEDHGTGIPREYFAKIFDPFFTTKQKGSGLGLATCFSIIKKHDGFIDLESELGKGTTFFIYLPASKTQFANINKPDDTVKDLRGSGRILIMDDEDFIRDVAGTMLEMLGYDVVKVANGEEALDQVKRSLDNKNRFKVAILDLTIPGGLGGVDTVKAINKIDPDIKTIASSGYSADPVMSDPKSFGFSATITKPYLKDELGTVLLSLIT